MFGSDVIVCGGVRGYDIGPSTSLAGSVTPALSRVTVRLFHVSFLFSEPQFSASVLSWCASWPHFCIWEPGF